MGRYVPMEFRLGYAEDGPSYRGFARRDPLYRWIKHWTRGWDRIEPFLPRTEAERFRADHRGRWDGETLEFPDPVTGALTRVERNDDGLYPLRDLGRRPRIVEWVAVFPDWPADPLDGSTIARLLDTPLPSGMHTKNRQPVIDRLHHHAEVPDLLDALRLARTDYARERLAYLLSYHRHAVQAADAVPAIVDLLEGTGPSDLRVRYAEAVADLAVRAPTAVRPFSARIEAAHTAATDEMVRDVLATALQALGRLPVDSPFIAETRRALDFLVDEFGFQHPVIVDAVFAESVTYRGPGIAVEVSRDRREHLIAVDLVRLDDQGGLPAPVDDDELVAVRLPWWALIASDRTGDSGDVLRAATAAIRGRPDYLNGDLTQWDADVSHWQEEEPD
jgi:hypothetical protein